MRAEAAGDVLHVVVRECALEAVVDEDDVLIAGETTGCRTGQKNGVNYRSRANDEAGRFEVSRKENLAANMTAFG